MYHSKTKIGDPFDFMMQEARRVHPVEPISPTAKMIGLTGLSLGLGLGAVNFFMQIMDSVYP
jgi:hypothetical protein